MDEIQIDQKLAVIRDLPPLTQEGADAYLQGFGEYIGVEDLHFNEAGMAEITVNESAQCVIICMPDFPAFVVAVPLSENLFDGASGRVALLEANLTFKGSFGGCFSQPAILDGPAFCVMAPVQAGEYEMFDQVVTHAVNVVLQIQEQLANLESKDSDEPEPPCDVPLDESMRL